MMNTIAIEIQNTFGRLVQLYHLNRLDLASDLFCTHARLWIPDFRIDTRGIGAIKERLSMIQKRRCDAGYKRDFHIPHTPGYDIDEKTQSANGTWLIHSFLFAETADGRDAIEYTYSRADVKFAFEGGAYKIAELDFWLVGSFVPWDYQKDEDKGLDTDISDLYLPPERKGYTTLSDFYKIQNIVTRFTHNNRKYAMSDAFANNDQILFAPRPVLKEAAVGVKAVQTAICQLNDMEAANKGKYVYVPAVSAPVIEVSEGGKTAEAQWMVSCYSFEGEAFGYNSTGYRFVRHIGILTCKLIREAEDWKILHYEVNILFTVPAIDYDQTCMEFEPSGGKRYQRMGLPENKWKPALPKMGGNIPDDIYFLESFPARWVNAYMRGEMIDFIEKYMINDEYDIYFHSWARGRNASKIIGPRAMREFFSMGVFHYHHQQITNHGGTAPDVEISADGRFATISLFDMNTTAYDPKKNVNDGNSNGLTLNVDENWNADNSGYEYTPTRFQFSKYEFSMAKVDGEWKLISVDWETLAAMPDQQLAGKKSRGWAGHITDHKYPILFEPYSFSGIRKTEDTKW